MVRRRKQDRRLFEVLLPDSDKLWPTWWKRIDTLLEDEAGIDTVAAALEQRWPQSRKRGRAGTPAEVVLRMRILKHLPDWSFDELEQEVRALGPEVITDLRQRVVDVAKRAGVTHGRRFRIDTTVVETNVHSPTDSTLLQDGVRALTRSMTRAQHAGDPRGGAVRNRLRSVTRLSLAISRQARPPKTRNAMIGSYRRLMTITRAVLRDAATMVRRTGQQLRTATGTSAQVLRHAQPQLQQMRPLVERVLADAGAPGGGDTHVPDKGLSVFEPHTEAIRQGKIAKPTEFGKLVTIQEAEHPIVTAFAVHPRRPSDSTLWTPALDRHHQIFQRVPDLATGDRGFSSARNERAATDRGIRRVVLPAQGRNTPARRAHERPRWFRRGHRWRTGCEGRISVLKRRHGLRRCRYRGEAGIHRWVGLGVIADNLINIATYVDQRAAA